MSEELLGEPAFSNNDFPRVIAGYSVTEAEYAIYFRDCAVAIFIMEQPISDRDHLFLALQIQFFIRGALHVSDANLNLDQFVALVKRTCSSSQIASLADGVRAASLEVQQ